MQLETTLLLSRAILLHRMGARRQGTMDYYKDYFGLTTELMGLSKVHANMV